MVDIILNARGMSLRHLFIPSSQMIVGSLFLFNLTWCWNEGHLIYKLVNVSVHLITCSSVGGTSTLCKRCRVADNLVEIKGRCGV